MAVDEMEIDSEPVPTGPAESEKERKRKHKHKDKDESSSKKKRKHETADGATSDKKSKKKKDKSKKHESKTESESVQQPAIIASDSLHDEKNSSYSLITATLYLPLSPISISPTHAKASLLAEHLSPLLLTYYPPFKGIILAYNQESISSSPPNSSSTDEVDSNTQQLTFARTAGEYGVMYVYLTATFLVFHPQRGDILEGWVNVQSEGFLGAVVDNLFSVGIERKRLPSDWKWVSPGEGGEESNQPSAATTSDEDDDYNSGLPPSFDPEKEHFTPVTIANPFADTLDADTDAGDDTAAEGYFQSASGHRVRGIVKFRVVDVDVIPGAEKDRWSLSIEGTMLSPEEEAKVLEDERNGVLVPSKAMQKILPVLSRTPQSSATSGVVASESDLVESPSKKPKSKSSKLRS